MLTTKNKETVSKLALLIFMIAAYCMLIMRFLFLEYVPPSLYVDEISAVSNAICFSENLRSVKTDAVLPLFFPTDYYAGVNELGFIYPLALWGTLFGFSIFSIKFFTASIASLACFGTAKIASVIFGRDVGRYVLLLSFLSPWAYHSSKLTWDATILPTYIVWAIYFFIRRHKETDLYIALVLFVLGLYTYSAGRVAVPLLVFIFTVQQVVLKQRPLRSFVLFYLICILSFSAVCYHMIYGRLSGRIAAVSIFSSYYRETHHLSSIYLLLKTFLQNFFLHFSPYFLFIDGDHINYRHSTKHFGVLSWAQAISLMGGGAALIYHYCKGRRFSADFLNLLIIFLCIGVGVLPAASTWDSLPHALRSCVSWPFFCILTGYLLHVLINLRPIFLPVVGVVSFLYVIRFYYVFFFIFPKESADFFDLSYAESARKADVPELISDSNLNTLQKIFFLNLHHGYSCGQTMNLLRGRVSH